MKRGLLFSLFFSINSVLLAQTEIGPEGHKLIWIFVIIIPLIIYLIYIVTRKNKKGGKRVLFKRIKTEISLVKDQTYYPDYLTLTIKNTGNTDIDLDRPLLIFDSFWMKRKFRLKGINHAEIYPLFLEVGKKHALEIDLNGFYKHDKKLKKFAKAKVTVKTVEGKFLGSKAVYLRKTLFKY